MVTNGPLNNIYTFFRFSSLFIIVLILGCNSRPKAENTTKRPPVVQENIQYTDYVHFISPVKNDTLKFNEEIHIQLSLKEGASTDSIELFLNNRKIALIKQEDLTHTFIVPDRKSGNNNLKVVAYHGEKVRSMDSRTIIIKPDKAPVRYTYDLIKTYPHDNKAYTQGLVYHEGYLYEGTGIYGESSLRKTEIKNGKVISSLYLDNNLFGEGITIYKDKIYQITWTSGKGFIYNLNNFSLESTFNYNTQGWGITTMGDKLVMSDGTHKLYHIRPDNFSVIKEVEVYDHNGPVTNLNELEYIDGLIWSNIWLKDRIVMIDPENGIVKGELDMSGILPPADTKKLNPRDDVLNGIAWNPDTRSIYLTGKRWPKLFEIKVK